MEYLDIRWSDNRGSTVLGYVICVLCNIPCKSVYICYDSKAVTRFVIHLPAALFKYHFTATNVCQTLITCT